MEDWISDIQFESIGPVRRILKTVLIHPFANYFPAGIIKVLLRVTKSELAAANWVDPGGWRSMVISYNGKPHQIADKILVGTGSMPMALRNRRKLAGRLIARLIDEAPSDRPEVLCLGAGPGQIITDALCQAKKPADATLVDLSSDAFDYGKELAKKAGVSDRVRFIQGDVRDVHTMLDRPPNVVKMMGICEYLDDSQIVSIAQCVSAEMPVGAAIVFNSISPAHGTDRFFRNVFGLHMIHRKVEHLQSLMGQAGFGEFKTFAEPLGVYHVIVGRKINGAQASKG